jgi:hypothetical protein
MVGTSFANDCFFKRLVEGFSTQFESGEGYTLPDSQAGHFRKFELRLLLDSRDEHDEVPCKTHHRGIETLRLYI